MFRTSALLLFILTACLGGHQGVACAQTRPPEAPLVHLNVISVRPLKDESGYLYFRIRLKLANLDARPVLLETLDGKTPFFTAYGKWLGWPPHWLNLGWPDAPAPRVLELKHG
jgi:hypothetical protein